MTGFLGKSDAAGLPGAVQIRVSPIAALQSAGGSVMLSPDAGGTTLLINRGEENDFYVLDPTCTHQGCRVDLYDAGNGGISCPCHGSFFSITGAYLGGPAPSRLNSYESSFDGNDTLSIKIPGITFQISSIQVQSTTGNRRRLRLTFPTLSFGLYRIHRTTTPNGQQSLASFSTTAAGNATATSLLGNGGNKSVWVDSTSSAEFFTLSLEFFEVN